MTAASLPKGTPILGSLLKAWSWFFLSLILAGFEVYAQVETGSTFLFRVYNIQSIAVAASGGSIGSSAQLGSGLKTRRKRWPEGKKPLPQRVKAEQ